MTVILFAFSFAVLVSTVFEGGWAYVFGGAIIISAFLIRWEKGLVVMFVILLMLLSVFLHQQNQSGFVINETLFSGNILYHEGEGRFVGEIGAKRVLVIDKKELLSAEYSGAFLGGGYFKKSVPGGIKFFDFGEKGDRYSKWLFMKGFAGAIYLNSFFPLHISAFESYAFVKKSIAGLKNRISYKIKDIYTGPYRGFVKAILLGDKGDLEGRQYRQLIDTGLVHVVVISGAHLGLLVLGLSLLLMWVPFYLRLILVFIGTTFYMLVVGGDPSILRAWILLGLYFLSLVIGREILVWRMLGIAWIIMLIYNPRLLMYDIGFVLSFAAVAGIVLISQFMRNFANDSFLKKAVNIFFVPLGAFLGILPVLLFFTGEINLWSWVLNIFILPLLPIIMLGSVISLLIPDVSFVVQKGIDIFWNINKWGLEYGVWLQTSKQGWRAGIFLGLSILWLYAAYLFFWKFLHKHRYEQLYEGSQGHKSISDQVKL